MCSSIIVEELPLACGRVFLHNSYDRRLFVWGSCLSFLYREGSPQRYKLDRFACFPRLWRPSRVVKKTKFLSKNSAYKSVNKNTKEYEQCNIMQYIAKAVTPLYRRYSTVTLVYYDHHRPRVAAPSLLLSPSSSVYFYVRTIDTCLSVVVGVDLLKLCRNQ